MRIFINKLVSSVIAVTFVVNISGCATYRVHPEFKERHKNIHAVTVMPPETDAYILTFQGDKKRLNDLVPIMEKTTVQELEKVLSDKGYVIKKLELGKEALDAKPQLRETLFNVNKLFTKSLEDIAKGKKKTFTYSLGSEVNTFADLAESDILIFTKEEGIKKSAGEIAKDVTKGLVTSAALLLIGVVYIPIPQTAATIAHVAIVDSNDGAILWYNNNAINVNWDPENQKQLAQLIKSLINPFPDSAFKKKDVKEKLIEKKHLEQVPTDLKKSTAIVPAGN